MQQRLRFTLVYWVFLLLSPTLQSATLEATEDITNLNSQKNLQAIYNDYKKHLGKKFAQMSHFYFAKNDSDQNVLVVYMKNNPTPQLAVAETGLQSTTITKICGTQIPIEVVYRDNDSPPPDRTLIGLCPEEPAAWKEYVCGKENHCNIL